jgi:hypothetical protein
MNVSYVYTPRVSIPVAAVWEYVWKVNRDNVAVVVMEFRYWENR